MYNNLFEEQQKYFNNLAENVKDFSDKMFKNFPFSNFPAQAQEFYKPYTDSFEKMMNMYKKNIPAPMAGTLQLYTDKIPGMEIYKKMMGMFQDMVKNPNDIMNTFMPKYNELISDVLKNFIPESGMKFLVKPTELMEQSLDYYTKYMSPWMNIDNELLSRVYYGDSKAYIEFFRTINEKYDETFGKVFNIMGFGLNRENYEEQMQLYSGYNKLMFASAELMAMVTDTLQDAAKDMFKKYNELLESGEEIKSFKDFYKIWFKSNEDTMLKLFNTDEFSKVFGAFADQTAKYMMLQNQAYEKVLAGLPIPTKTDMDSLYKTVYELRKDVRNIKKELEKLGAKK